MKMVLPSGKQHKVSNAISVRGLVMEGWCQVAVRVTLASFLVTWQLWLGDRKDIWPHSANSRYTLPQKQQPMWEPADTGSPGNWSLNRSNSSTNTMKLKRCLLVVFSTLWKYWPSCYHAFRVPDITNDHVGILSRCLLQNNQNGRNTW